MVVQEPTSGQYLGATGRSVVEDASGGQCGGATGDVDPSSSLQAAISTQQITNKQMGWLHEVGHGMKVIAYSIVSIVLVDVTVLEVHLCI